MIMINDMGKLLNVSAPETRSTSAMVHLESKPLYPGMTPMTNRLVKFTNFNYSIRFAPNTEDRERSEEEPDYILIADILPNGKLRFKNTTQLCEIMRDKKNKYSTALCWLAKWTSLLDIELHDVCYWSTDVPIPICFNVVKYAKHIISQIPGTPDRYPVFLTYEKAQKRIKRFKEYSKTEEYIQKKQNRGVMIYDFT